jgi:hypothetical protein
MSDATVGIKLKADATGLVGQMTNAKGQMTGFGNAADKAGKKAKKSGRDIATMEVASGKLLSKLSLVASSLLTTFGATAIVRGITDTARRFEILKASLETATGSAEDANKVFVEIQRIAATTPFAVEEITTAFIKLTNLGLNPSQAALRSYMNTASAMGKSLDQFIEAVADASVAEFERLKEFGIKAKNQGDTIAFTFRGVKTEVKNNAAEIEKFLQDLGNNQFGGAMARQAKTLDGAISNLGDSWDGLKFTIAEAGVSDLMKDGIRGVGSELDTLTDSIASGQMIGHLQALAGAWRVWGTDVQASINGVSTEYQQQLWALESITTETLKFLGQAFLQFPQNVRAMVQILTVEFASLIDVGSAYGAAFGQVVGVELAKMVRKAGIYGKELADIMAFWDGDTYNPDAALAQADAIAQGMTQSYFAAAEAQVNVARDARLATITGIVQERDAAINSYQQQITAANALAAAKGKDAANDSNYNLGQFAVTPEGEQGDTGAAVTNSQLEKLRESLLNKEEVLALHLLRKQEMLSNALAQGKITEDEHNTLSLAANKKYHDDKAAYSAAKNNLILSSSQQIFGALAGLAKTFGGKQSKAYKVMFAVQKGFAIAQGILNLSTAISNASAIPFPANIPAMATAAANGASLVASIQGASYQGQAHDGLRRATADSEGTYTVRRDEMVLNPRQRENFEKVVANTENGKSANAGNEYNFAPTIQIDATNATPGMEQMIENRVRMAMDEYDAKLQNDFASGGPRSQMLSGRAA